jgi:hypothetical protein
MRPILVILVEVLSPVLVAWPAAIPGQRDAVCRAYCHVLAVQNGLVRYIDQAPHVPRNLLMGHYVREDQPLVPETEAPIRDLRTHRGWRVVVSAFLDHDDDGIGLRLRFFAPDGKLRETDDVLMGLEEVQIGSLFGGTDEIFAITSNEEHAYNAETRIWFLPESGSPAPLLSFRGELRGFTDSARGKTPGVAIARQMYDGVHAETKGTVQEIYLWKPETRDLSLQPR